MSIWQKAYLWVAVIIMAGACFGASAGIALVLSGRWMVVEVEVECEKPEASDAED